MLTELAHQLRVDRSTSRLRYARVTKLLKFFPQRYPILPISFAFSLLLFNKSILQRDFCGCRGKFKKWSLTTQLSWYSPLVGSQFD